MPRQSLAVRVENLEVNVAALEELPARVAALDAQFLQFRTEVRNEFSAVRAEIRAGDEETRHLIRQSEEETRRQMRVLHEELIGRIALLQEAADSKKSPARPHDRPRRTKKPRPKRQ